MTDTTQVTTPVEQPRLGLFASLAALPQTDALVPALMFLAIFIAGVAFSGVEIARNWF